MTTTTKQRPATTKGGLTIQNAKAIGHLMTDLVPFISRAQRNTLISLIQTSEERDYFTQTIFDLKAHIDAMPHTGQTEGQGMDAFVQLHYFRGNYDAWITEKDVGDGSDDLGQYQAFGWASFHGFSDGELGYISIAEIIDADVELDLHWTPKPLRDVAGKNL